MIKWLCPPCLESLLCTVSGQQIPFWSLMTFGTGMQLLCFCAFMTVYTEPSAFPSVNTQSSLQVQSMEFSASLQCAWQNAHRPAAFLLLTPGMEFLSEASCGSLWPEHSLAHSQPFPAWVFDHLSGLLRLWALLSSTHAWERKVTQWLPLFR